MPAGRVATLDRRFIQDPNAFYRALAVRDPAHSAQLWGGLGAWLVAGDAEARAMLTGPRLTKNADQLSALLPPGTDSLLLGAPLARMEAEAAIGGLLGRFDTSTLQEGFTPRYRTSVLMRSLLTLPVRLQRAEREPSVVAEIA